MIHGLHLLLIRTKNWGGDVGNNKAGDRPIIMASKLGYAVESVTFA